MQINAKVAHRSLSLDIEYLFQNIFIIGAHEAKLHFFVVAFQVSYKIVVLRIIEQN